MRCALAIDGGGSKTDAVAVDERGHVLGWGRGGPMHSYYSTPDEVQASYRAAVTQALGEVQSDGFWVSDVMGRHGMLDELVADHGPVCGYVRGCEVETAFASVQESWGMVVLSGTGSFVYGRTEDDRMLHFGGLGPTLGDYGSAYAVGLRGLRAAFASQWAPRRKTSLEMELLKVYDLPDLHALFNRVYQQGLSRRETAASARIVNEQAEAGDAVAVQCLIDAADELVEVALDIVEGLQMHDLSFPMIAVGSVAQNSRLWWQRISERVQAVAPYVRPMIPQVRPVIGGALLALRELGVEWTPELLATIRETQKPFLQRL